MKGLIIKDLLNIKNYAKTLLLVLVLFAIISFTSSTSILSSMIIAFSAMLTIYTFSYDDFCKWDMYALTLPITKKQIVLSKYLLFILITAIGFVLSTIIAIIFNYIKPVTDIVTILASQVGVVLVMIFLTSLLLPIVFKYGPEKSRILMFLVFIIPFGLIFLLTQISIPILDESTLNMIVALIPIAIILIFIASYFISLKIYNKKEI